MQNRKQGRETYVLAGPLKVKTFIFYMNSETPFNMYCSEVGTHFQAFLMEGPS